MRDSIVFYRSFYEAIKDLNNETQLTLYKSIMDYSFNNEVPNDLEGVAKSLFVLMKPNIDSAEKRYQASVQNGRKGGRPKTQEKPNNNLEETQEKPNNNLDITQQEPSENLNVDVDVNVDVNDNKDKEVNVNKKNKSKETFESVINEYTQNETLRQDLLDYVDMRKQLAKQKKEVFTIGALKRNLTELDKLASDDETKCAIVNRTITKSWKGFFKLDDNSKQEYKPSSGLDFSRFVVGSKKDNNKQEDKPSSGWDFSMFEAGGKKND